MLIQVKATCRQLYGGKSYLAGDPMQVEEAEAADMVALRLVERVPQAKQNVASTTYTTRQIEDEESDDKEKTGSGTVAVPPTPGRYNRRDMRPRRS